MSDLKEQIAALQKAVANYKAKRARGEIPDAYFADVELITNRLWRQYVWESDD